MSNPYDYMDSFDTFSEKKLPTKDDFYSIGVYTEEKLHFATKSFTFSRSSGNTLAMPDDRENVKLLVAKCSFSSVYTSYVLLYFTYWALF